MPLKGMLRLSEAVEPTGLSHDTLRRRCRNGEIRGAVLDGKTWYIPAAAVPGLNRKPSGPKPRPAARVLIASESSVSGEES
ncbi:MAG TPA: hypothetical protein VNA32_03745 [Actinomycetota bacterium]|nr:hypothetical protein [Actinomycetota bacterium]